ncbi:MAG: VIT family protein [Rhizobacter sp.]|nr:VIT family protein [Rhizobacter sp.]
MNEIHGAANPGASQGGAIASRLNCLRGGVMGANDRIVSTAGMVVGVAAASVSDQALMVSGVAAVLAGAVSMGVAELVSVSSQRDSERAVLEHDRRELAGNPTQGIEQLAGLVTAHGIDRDLAHRVAVQLSAKDPLAAHARLELGIDPEELVNPWHAGLGSMVAFTVGGLIPFAAIVLSPRSAAVSVTAAAVVLALTITGTVSAHLGRAWKTRAVLRAIGAGALAMGITAGVGSLVGDGVP